MTYPYHIQEWIEDWRNVLEATSTVPKENADAHFRRIFLSRYPNPKEAHWKCARILNAVEYMEANLDAFEKAGLLIASSKGGNVGKHLSFALYRFFSYVDDLDVKNPPLPKVFIEAAEEDRKNYG